MSGKIIHKIAAAGAGVLVAASSCATVSAFGHSYYLPEAAEMSITVPGQLITITRNASEGDSYFTTFHQDYTATMEDFQTNNIYLQGMDSTASLTVTVTMVESAESQGTVNYNQLSSEQLSEIAKSFLKDSSYTACRVDTSGKDINWLQFDTNINGTKGLLANTVVDGKSINVSMNRNGSDISEDDGKEFASMISGVRFGERNFFEQYGMMILVAIAAILVVAVITMIILRVIRSRGGEKPTIHDENERILEELAGKYARKPIAPADNSESIGSEDNAEFQASEEVAAYEDGSRAENTDTEVVDEEAVIENTAPKEEMPLLPQEGELLGAEDIDVFTDETIAEAEALAEESAAAEDDKPVPQELSGDEEDDFFAGSDLAIEEAYETIETETPARVEAEVPQETEPAETEEEVPTDVTEEAAAEQNEVAEPEEALGAEEETQEAEEAPAAETKETESEEPEEEEPEEEEPEEAFFEEFEEEEEEPDEFEEYMNDEVLVRQDVKSNKFRNSSDFFDEAPRKSMGVINSRDLVDAEEYDVLGEEEKRAEKVKREEPEPPKKEKKKKEKKKKEKKEKTAKSEETETQEKADDADNAEKKEKKEKKKSDGFRVFMAAFLAGCRGFFAGCKSFFTHCGYFIINVSRAIKRRHAKKKRKKEAEERRRRALRKAAEQRAQARNREAQARSREEQREKPRTNGGLVQVRSRGERRPSSQSGQRRPSQSAQRRPSSSRPPQKRRPSSSRPPQKRRPPSQSSQRRK